MRVVTPTGTNNIHIIPRRDSLTWTVIITDRETNETTILSEHAKQVYSDYVNLILTEENYNFKEGRYYDLRIKSSYSILHREILFCTEQTIDQPSNYTYDINEGEYTPNETTNEYIVI